MAALILTMTAILLHLYYAHAQDDFINTVIESEYANVSLYCSNTSSLPDDVSAWTPIAWMLPNFTVLDYPKFEGDGKFNLSDEGWSLFIVNASSDDLGQYHCMIRNGSEPSNYKYLMVKLGLNAYGPYFESLTKKYKMNIIIGVSSAASFAVICLFLYLLDRFRYRDPVSPEKPLPVQKQDDGSETNGTPTIKTSGVENAGFDGEMKGGKDDVEGGGGDKDGVKNGVRLRGSDEVKRAKVEKNDEQSTL